MKTNKHLEQRPHHFPVFFLVPEQVLLASLQLKNTGKYCFKEEKIFPICSS
jgi:hypothetical protein